MPEGQELPSLPSALRDRLRKEDDEVRDIVKSAAANIQTKLPAVAFSFTSSTAGDILTVEERAQSVSFITRYELIPTEVKVQLVERDSAWYIENFAALGHVLNDFRPLIQNKRDAVYHQNVHKGMPRSPLNDDGGLVEV